MGDTIIFRREDDSSHFIIDAPPVEYWNCNVYAVDFSPDGRWLALGCGGWYGHGAIAIVDCATMETKTILRFGSFGRRATGRPGEVLANLTGPESLTISGLAFDASGNYLAACSWSSSQRPGPCFLFSVVVSEKEQDGSAISLSHRSNFITRNGTPTGICFSSQKLFVRCHRSAVLGGVICPFDIPDGLRVDTDVPHRHRSHSRIVVAPGSGVLAETDDNNTTTEDVITGFSLTDEAHGLATVRDGHFKHHPSDNLVTAILALPTRLGKPQELVTGGRKGRIILWRRSSSYTKGRKGIKLWRRGGCTDERDEAKWIEVLHIRGKTTREAPVEGAWAAYKPQSIVAFCALDEGDRFFSADASGEILEWSSRIQGRWTVIRRRVLPRPGTPRSMAVHPSASRRGTALLAVGVKAGDSGGTRRGFVACFEVDLAWYNIGHFLVLRKLITEGRATALKPSEGGRDEVLERLMTNVDFSLFRTILSFLIPSVVPRAPGSREGEMR